MRRKKLPDMPEPSRFDRFDEATLFTLAEQALMTAGRYLQESASDTSRVAELAYCDTALSDAQAAVQAALRRRIALAQNL
jgi:hypothetical protein